MYMISAILFNTNYVNTENRKCSGHLLDLSCSEMILYYGGKSIHVSF